MASPRRRLLLLLPLVASAAALVLEDGYTVSTAADLNPSDLHPYALLPGTSSSSTPPDPRSTPSPSPFPLAHTGSRAPRTPSTAPAASLSTAPTAPSARSRPPVWELHPCQSLQYCVHCLVRLLGSCFGIFTLSMQEVSINRFFSRIQKQYKITQRKVALISFYDARSVAVSSMLYALLHKLVRVCLGYLSVMLPSVRLERGVPYEPAPSLLDLDNPGSGSTATRIGLEDKALPSTDHLGDFIGFDGDADIKEGNESALSATAQEDEEPSIHSDLLVLLDGSPEGSSKKIDSMIQANLSDFSGQEKYAVSASNCSGVSRRRLCGE